MVDRYQRFVRDAVLVVAGLAALAALVAHAGVNAHAAADYRDLGALPFEYRWEAGQLLADPVPPELTRDSGLQSGDQILRIAAEPVGDGLQQGHALFWRDQGRLLRRGQNLSLTTLQQGLLREVRVPLRAISPAQAREVTRIQAMMLPKQIAGFCLWLLGVLVLLRRRDAVTRVFFLWCVALALYTASSAVAVFLWDSYPPALITLFRTGFMAGWFFAPALFGHFCQIYAGGPESSHRRRRLRPALSYPMPIAAFLWMGGFSPAGIVAGFGGRLLWLGLAMSWLAALGLGIGLLLRVRARTNDPLRRKQIQFVLAGSLAYVLVFLHTFTAAVAGWEADPTTAGAWLPHVLLLVTPLAFAYAILRHRLLDLDVVIRRSLVFTVITLCMGGLFIVLQQIAGAVLQAKAGATGLPAQTFAAMMVAALFGPAERRLGRLIESRFNRRKLRRLERLHRLTREIDSITDPARLQQSLVEQVAELFELRYAALHCWESASGLYRLVRAAGPGVPTRPMEFGRRDSLAVWLVNHRLPLEFAMLQQECALGRLNAAESARLEALEATLCVPLCAGGQLAGFLTLGIRPDDDGYSGDEKVALLALADRAAAALHQAELERRLAQLEQERTHLIAAPSPILLTSARG